MSDPHARAALALRDTLLRKGLIYEVNGVIYTTRGGVAVGKVRDDELQDG